MKKIVITLIIFSTLFLSTKNIDKQGLAKITTNDDYNFISINNILMWQANNGDGSHDPFTEGNGFYWPKDSITRWGRAPSAIFEDGLIWGGIVDGDIRVGGNTYRTGLQAGKILANGEADDPNLEKYRVYKIRKDWQSLPEGEEKDQYQKDFEEWPVEDGAPWIDVDDDGIYTKGIDQPKHEGDETLWFVANDFDSTRTTRLYGKPPVGLEMQSTVFAFNKPGFEDVVFKKYKIINKGQNNIEEMYFGIWSDPDLGDASDDYVGCDTLLDLAFAWNGDNQDDVYGSAPPSVGYQFLAGPHFQSQGDSAYYNNQWNLGYKNLDMTSFTFFVGASNVYSDPRLSESIGSIQMYNYLTNKVASGNYLIDPNNGQQVKYALSGDPMLSEGWFEGSGWPGGPAKGDRRLVGGMGSIIMAPGDSQEIIIALIIAKGNNHVNSVGALKNLARKTKTLFFNNFQSPLSSMPSTNLAATDSDTSITLYWDDAALLLNHKDYVFEGYKIYQHEDERGTNPQLIRVYDIENTLLSIWDYQQVNDIWDLAPILNLPNEGLKYTIEISKDYFSDQNLLIGSEYFYGISSFAYSKESSPRYLESNPSIIKVIPGKNKIDVHIPYAKDDIIIAEQSSGFGDGNVSLNIIDADILTDSEYRVVFSGPLYALRYSFIDLTLQDTLVIEKAIINKNYWNENQTPNLDTLKVIDGFQLIVENLGFDRIDQSLANNAIKEVVETKGPSGIEFDNPLNVLDSSYNSTGRWFITAEDLSGISIPTKQNINFDKKAGRGRYEIRFTTPEEGSEYYAYRHYGSFLQTAPFKTAPKAPNKVPFQIWTLGDDLISKEDDYQMIIKVMDTEENYIGIEDGVWSQFPADDSLRANQWERIFAYLPKDTLYPDVLPNESGLSNRFRAHHKIGNIIITGELPEPGTVVQIDTWRPLSTADTFLVTVIAPIKNDYAGAKKKLDQISVFPNPYFGVDPFGRFPNRNYMRFTDLPQKVTIRIFTLAGQLVSKIEKDSASPWLDWDLRNQNGKAVASGIYIAHLEMPKIGKKVMKLAVVQDNE